MSLALAAYGGLTRALEPFAGAVLRRRAAAGKEDAARLSERLGRTRAPRPDGELVWLHGASVGESLSHLPLIRRLHADRPDLTLLVTSGTVTAAEVLAARLPKGAVHQYLPLDAPGAARRFLDHWRPATAVFVESELWPNLLRIARRRGVRLALLGARVSDDSVQGWRRAPAALRRLLGGFDLILAQDLATREWMQAHGATVSGLLNLKLAGDPLPHDPDAFLQLRGWLGERPPIVAASTHPGEEEVVAEAFQALPTTEPRPILIVVPRHPRRGPGVAAALREMGLTVALRSAGERPDGDAYVADTLGELGLFYELARVVVMGGAFFEGVGGHNPLEPARLGAPVISGPHVSNFRDVYDALREERGVIIAADEAELTTALSELLAHPQLAQHVGRAGLRYCRRQQGALDAAWTALQPLLPPAPPSEDAA